LSWNKKEAKLLGALRTMGSDAAKIARGLDCVVIDILFFAIIAALHSHMMLTVDDWDFWVDWKDRKN